MQTEAQIQADILLAIGSRPDMRVWRANTGVARDAKTGRRVRFGVPGQADIQGLLAPSGRALYIEVKSAKGRQSQQQRRFETMITKHGGLYILARSVQDVLDRLPE